MIAVLLFLILFALLFPKALKFLLALAFISGMVILGEAHASPGQCFLKVNGTIYINKICNVEGENHGSYTLGAGESSGDRYFVYLNRVDKDTMTGYWNGIEAESHANDPLGILSKSGDCWANDHAKVCAWESKRNSARPNTHQKSFEYYSPGQMYSGPLGAHIGPGPHVMAPYTGW